MTTRSQMCTENDSINGFCRKSVMKLYFGGDTCLLLLTEIRCKGIEESNLIVEDGQRSCMYKLVASISSM